MCGRFVVASSPQLLADQFGVDDLWVDSAEPSYNVAPTEQVMVVRERQRDGEERRTGRLGRPGAQEAEHAEPTRPRRVLSRARWGLVPSWAKDPSVGNRMINARAETLTTKSAYKKAFATHRCLIPADGFYEWKPVAPPSTPKGRPRKQPVFIHKRDGEPMAFAGLWAAWKAPDGFELEGIGEDGWLRSCVIVTTDANELLMPIHDRMPVVLPKSEWDRWLDPDEHNTDALEPLLVPTPSEQLELWPVSTLVNKPENKGSEVAKPVEAIDGDS